MIGDVLKTCLECIVVTVKCLDGKISQYVKNRFLSLIYIKSARDRERPRQLDLRADNGDKDQRKDGGLDRQTDKPSLQENRETRPSLGSANSCEKA